jgi:NADPH:quinone reductase-like Zn-dependent oxidoreductase
LAGRTDGFLHPGIRKYCATFLGSIVQKLVQRLIQRLRLGLVSAYFLVHLKLLKPDHSMASNVPPTMKAWTYSQAGSPRQVLSLKTVPSPKPPTGDQVMIKVAYCALQFGDLKIMKLIPTLFRPRDSRPGVEYSGTIVAAGTSVASHLSVGTRVFGVLDSKALIMGSGALCEYICISTTKNVTMAVPEDCTLKEAACIPVGGTMAYLICKNGGIGEDCNLRILVNGASGGCGTIFLQAAKAMGPKQIVATCSEPNFELVKSLGADKAFDYRGKQPLDERLAREFGDRKFDIVVDTVGAQGLYEKSPLFLKEDGVYVNIGDFTHGLLATIFYWIMNYLRPVWLGGTPRRWIMFGPDVGPDAGVWVQKLVADGKVKAVIDRSVGFDQVLDVSLCVQVLRPS